MALSCHVSFRIAITLYIRAGVLLLFPQRPRCLKKPVAPSVFSQSPSPACHQHVTRVSGEWHYLTRDRDRESVSGEMVWRPGQFPKVNMNGKID